MNVQSTGSIVSLGEIEAHVRSMGLIGPIDDEFLEDVRWSMLGAETARALAETDAYPDGVAGMRAYFEDLLGLDVASAAAVPPTAPVRVVARRAQELLAKRIAL